MKRLLLLTIVGSFIILTVSAMTGDELLARCEQVSRDLQNQDQPSSYNSWWCLGYVKGYADAHAYASVVVGRSLGKKTISNTDGILYCPPPTVTYDQLATIVINYLKQHPEQLKYDTEVLAGQALSNAFPCPPR